MKIYVHLLYLAWILLGIRNFSDKNYIKNRNTHFMYGNLLPYMVEPERPQISK
jgi:hypothetical protein